MQYSEVCEYFEYLDSSDRSTLPEEGLVMAEMVQYEDLCVELGYKLPGAAITWLAGTGCRLQAEQERG